MIFKTKNSENENTKFFVGCFKTDKMMDINDGNFVDKKDFDELRPDKMLNNKFNAMLESVERLSRVLLFMNSFNNRTAKIFGRIYKIKMDNKILKREFFAFSEDDLDKTVGKLEGEMLLEICILDDSVDIQKIMQFCRLNKVKQEIYHFHDIEDNEVYLAAKFINRQFIPNFIKNYLETNETIVKK